LDKLQNLSALRLPTLEGLKVNFDKVLQTKLCPSCGILIQKIGGCNRVKCTKCEFEMCWTCMGSIIQFQNLAGQKNCLKVQMMRLTIAVLILIIFSKKLFGGLMFYFSFEINFCDAIYLISQIITSLISGVFFSQYCATFLITRKFIP
jgi:hypothetical protein